MKLYSSVGPNPRILRMFMLERGVADIPTVDIDIIAGENTSDDYKALNPAAQTPCLQLDNGRFDVLWGCDEMLLSALTVGASGAVGSTYNIAAPLYHRMIEAFEQGNLDAARRDQTRSGEMIRVIGKWPFHPAMKEVLRSLGIDCGRCRLPQATLSEEEVVELRSQLRSIGFYTWRG